MRQYTFASSMPDRFHWVVPQKLAGMSLPGRVSELADDLALVKRHGIGAVASLTEHPLEPPAVVAASGLIVTHIPIDDFSVPSLDQVREFCAFADENIGAGRPVAAHCYAGLGRTGLMLACWLVRTPGTDAKRVLSTIRRIEPGFVQTPEQEAFISIWESTLRK